MSWLLLEAILLVALTSESPKRRNTIKISEDTERSIYIVLCISFAILGGYFWFSYN